MYSWVRVLVVSGMMLGASAAPGFATPQPSSNPWQIAAELPTGAYHGGVLNAVSAASAGRAWAVGFNANTGGIAFTYAGGRWSRQHIDHYGYWDMLDVAAVSNTEAWAVAGAYGTGDFGAIFHYQSGHWQFVRQTNGNAVSVAASTPDNVDVVTCNYEDGGLFTLYHYNGQRWSTPRVPHASRVDDCASGITAIPGRNRFILTGTYISTQGHNGAFDEVYDGSRWTLTRTKQVNRILDLTATRSGTVFGVGTTRSGRRDVALTRRLGTAWTPLAAPPDPVGAAAAGSPTDLWAVGGGYATTLDHYNGSSWASFPDPNPSDGYVADVGAIPGTHPAAYWAVGTGATQLTILYKPPHAS
jgi:VCBS repeat-containing protein